jgi:hypothetical protein
VPRLSRLLSEINLVQAHIIALEHPLSLPSTGYHTTGSLIATSIDPFSARGSNFSPIAGNDQTWIQQKPRPRRSLPISRTRKPKKKKQKQKTKTNSKTKTRIRPTMN